METIVKQQIIEAKVNEPFSIDLEGNASTGYSWYLANLPEGLLLFSAIYTTNPHPYGMVGVPGKSTFSFTSDKEVDAELTFVYKRAWNNEDVRYATYQIRVTK
ncbi:protease inhibitor I42 family protein [Tenacibaculum amylolyticum]|uniref:protease inhibitor I42 family protein n=1 Tax=Tenacibaculum amylolyticum TaxID=104269 RepID=UPI003893F084